MIIKYPLENIYFGIGKIKYDFYFLYLHNIYTQMNNMKESLHKLYNKTTYLDMYGGSLFITLFTLLIFFIIFSYFRVMGNIKPIKQNWSTQRCSPAVIPFAGIINPSPNKSAFETTGENFNYCLNNILSSITSDVIAPIHYLLNGLSSIMGSIMNDIQMVRQKFDSMISNIEQIDQEIMGRILNFLMPIRLMFIKFKDMIGKVNGVLVANLYTIISGYFGIKAFIGSFVTIMIEGLLILTAIIVPLLLFFFTAPIAIPFLAAFGIIAGFTIAIIIGLEDIIHMSTSSIPSTPTMPHCFDSETMVEMNDGTCKKIKEIQPGDILLDNNFVTSTFEVKRYDDMYSYNNVIVTGNHYVYYHNEWVQVHTIPTAIKIENYKNDKVYCLNTTATYLIINKTIFSDWNDIDDLEMNDINNNQKNKLSRCELKNLEKSLKPNTLVKLNNGDYEEIKNLKIGDILIDDSEVIGLVKLFVTKIRRNNNQENKLKEYNYHLLTSSKKFKTEDDEIINDYNNNLEQYL